MFSSKNFPQINPKCIQGGEAPPRPYLVTPLIITVSSDESAATDAIVSDESAATDANIDPEFLFDSVNYSSIFRAGLNDNVLDNSADYEADFLVTQPLSFQQGNSYDSFPNPPASLYFDVCDISGPNMSDDRWPRVFNELSDRAFVATQRPDGLQIPNAWLSLICLLYTSDAADE